MAMLSRFSIQHLEKVKYNYFKSKGSSSNNIAQMGKRKPTKMQPKLNSTQTAVDCREQQLGSLYSETY